MLRELAGKNGFAMWCPGRLCITTPSMFEELENPFGEDDDKMYPTKVGGSHVDEKKFKNLKECLSYCSEEFSDIVGEALYELGVEVSIELILTIIIGTILIAVFPPLGAIELGAKLGYFIMGIGGRALVGIAKALVWNYFRTYRPCVIYCKEKYKG